MLPTYQPIPEVLDGGAGEVMETIDVCGTREVADGSEYDVILSHPRMPVLRGRVLPLPLPYAWAHSVCGGTPEACRSDVRIRVICPMPAGS